MADLADDIRALEEALAAGPTPDNWHVKSSVREGAVTDLEKIAMVPDAHHVWADNGLFICGFEEMEPEVQREQAANVLYIAAANPDRIQRVLGELQQLREQAARYHWLCAHLTQIHVETTQPAGSPSDAPMRVTLIQAWPNLPRTDAASVDAAVVEAMRETP